MHDGICWSYTSAQPTFYCNVNNISKFHNNSFLIISQNNQNFKLELSYQHEVQLYVNQANVLDDFPRSFRVPKSHS